MPVHVPPQTTTRTPSSSGSAGGSLYKDKSSAGTTGYQQGSQRLAPTSGVTIAGVPLTAAATGSTFLALERALGYDTAQRARAAAKDGGGAVLVFFAPYLPAGATRLPLAGDVADAYARWAKTAPPLTKPSSGHGKDERKATPKNLQLGKYGLMVDFEAALGTELGLLAAAPGQSVGVHASGAVSVEGIYVAMGVDLEAAHGDGEFEVKGTGTFELGLGTTGENVSLREVVSVAGHGDDAVEAMHMAGLAIERWLRAQQFDWKNPTWEGALATGKKFLVNVATFEAAGPMGVMGAGALALAGGKIADALWGRHFEEDVVQTMDEDDYGETSIGIGVGGRGGEEGVGLDAEVGYRHTTRVQNVNGAVGSQSEDVIGGAFALEVEGGGFEIGLSGHMDVPIGGESVELGLELELGREEHASPVASVVADLAVSSIRGLAATVGARAGGFVGRVAEAMDTFMRAKAIVDAIEGVGALRVSADYDLDKGELEVSGEVVKELSLEAEAPEEAEISISFEVGQQVLAKTFEVGRL